MAGDISNPCQNKYSEILLFNHKALHSTISINVIIKNKFTEVIMVGMTHFEVQALEFNVHFYDVIRFSQQNE